MAKESTEIILIPHPYIATIKGGLRSIAASIPVCASISQGWNEYETNRTNSRIQELFDNLQSELEELQNTVSDFADKINLCHDFPELLEIVVDKVRKEYGESTRSTYAQVLAKLLITGDTLNHDNRVALLESLDSLSDMDIKVLMLFQGIEKTKLKNIQWGELGIEGNLSEQLWELSCHLAKLASRGLVLNISQHDGAVYVPNNITSDAARFQEGTYRLLPLGARLIEILN